MSALAGIFYTDERPVSRADLVRMLESMSHRGADGEAVWSSESVGLAHRLLHTTPESLHEKLPLVSSVPELVLTADARLDNRNELSTLLERPDLEAEHVPDSTIILEAYRKWGDECATRLLGDFAFAIWDSERQRLFCARDHMGIKPFYYYRSGATFVFASEIKAITAVTPVSGGVNETRIGDYLEGVLDDSEMTFHRSVFRLPAAHSMTVSRTQVRCWRYWALDPEKEIRLGSDEEYAERFAELFTEAVRCRMRSAFPVGSMLSGGLDSSSVACTARRVSADTGQQPIHTFSAIYPDVPACDERSHMEKVLAQGGFEPHFVPASSLSPLRDAGLTLRYEDEPMLGPNMYITWALYRSVGEHGVRVVMEGFDGDTTVSHGSRFLTELARAGRWSDFATEAQGLSELRQRPAVDFLRSEGFPCLARLARDGELLSAGRAIGQISRSFGISPLVPVMDGVFRPLVVEPLRRRWRRLRSRTKGSESPFRLADPDFATRLGLAERHRPMKARHFNNMQTAREDHHRRLTAGTLPMAFEMLDRAGAAFAVEPRFPFFDRRLVEFCLALPPEQKLNGGWTRIVLRRAMNGILPQEIQWRRDKMDIGPNFQHGLVRRDRQLLERLIFADVGPLAGYVDLRSLRKAYDQVVTVGGAGPATVVWRAVTLSLWLRQNGSSNPRTSGTTTGLWGRSQKAIAEKNSQYAIGKSDRTPHTTEHTMENNGNMQPIAGRSAEAHKKRYDTPELTKLGDVATITQAHSGISCKDLPFGSQDDIKSCT